MISLRFIEAIGIVLVVILGSIYEVWIKIGKSR